MYSSSLKMYYTLILFATLVYSETASFLLWETENPANSECPRSLIRLPSEGETLVKSNPRKLSMVKLIPFHFRRNQTRSQPNPNFNSAKTTRRLSCLFRYKTPETDIEETLSTPTQHRKAPHTCISNILSLNHSKHYL